MFNIKLLLSITRLLLDALLASVTIVTLMMLADQDDDHTPTDRYTAVVPVAETGTHPTFGERQCAYPSLD